MRAGKSGYSSTFHLKKSSVYKRRRHSRSESEVLLLKLMLCIRYVHGLWILPSHCEVVILESFATPERTSMVASSRAGRCSHRWLSMALLLFPCLRFFQLSSLSSRYNDALSAAGVVQGIAMCYQDSETYSPPLQLHKTFSN